LNTFVCGEYYPAFYGPFSKRRNSGNPCQQIELAELSFKLHTNNVTHWQQQRHQKEPGSTDAAKVCLTAVLLVPSSSHGSCHTRCSYPTTTKFTTQLSTQNTTTLEARAQHIMAHFGVAATCVPQLALCISMPATGDDHVVRMQNSSSVKAEIAIQC
jgi:hypothetical protein